jgi:hypothetical protein
MTRMIVVVVVMMMSILTTQPLLHALSPYFFSLLYSRIAPKRDRSDHLDTSHHNDGITNITSSSTDPGLNQKNMSEALVDQSYLMSRIDTLESRIVGFEQYVLQMEMRLTDIIQGNRPAQASPTITQLVKSAASNGSSGSASTQNGHSKPKQLSDANGTFPSLSFYNNRNNATGDGDHDDTD